MSVNKGGSKTEAVAPNIRQESTENPAKETVVGSLMGNHFMPLLEHVMFKGRTVVYLSLEFLLQMLVSVSILKERIALSRNTKHDYKDPRKG